MAFQVFTDSCSNLPGAVLKALDIHVLPCSYTVNGKLVEYSGDIETFDAPAYYDRLRAGCQIKTSLLNTDTFLRHFRPVLENGEDVVYVGLSGGISGTIQAALIAADDLKEDFPDRTVRVVDSMGAGLGTGILTCRAADLRNEGKTAEEAGALLDEERMHLCEFFTVGDLKFLKNTGRISAATAALGNVLNIKPVLYGDDTGHITACHKARGRKKAVEYIVQMFREKATDVENSRVAISHGDCPEEAQELADRLCAIAKPKELIICPHEPFTGAHVGPGMLAAFFFGTSR